MLSDKFSVTCVDPMNADDVADIKVLFREYNREVGTPPGFDDDKYLAGVLRRLQQEPDCRWLLIARNDDKVPGGFSWFKLDKDERAGWGYIMEFFVRPDHRSKGLGRDLLRLSCKFMEDSGLRQIWLTSSASAEAFWQACGFVFTGETYENGKKVMIRTL